MWRTYTERKRYIHYRLGSTGFFRDIRFLNITLKYKGKISIG
jgi:hypothetical protein